MPDPRSCPHCGTDLPPRSPEGLCPRCLLEAALAGATSVDPGHSAAETVLRAAPARGVVETNAVTMGPITRVLLPETGTDEDDSPMVRPFSAEMPAGSGGRLQLFGEIARGGMGAVLRGRDPDLGRDLAVKVLLEGHRKNPDLVRRFVEEAQIAGQLQHPGVVPVYEMGQFADARPYFSMKLVKGRTLAQVLGDRPDPTSGLSGHLATWLQICQTVAYAHSRGVIHRDLKPSNVMLGSFGEVQVMDWGLAKVLARGGVADDASAGKVIPDESLIATARSGGDGEALSQHGSILGTPAYMAPEQARGEIARIDERCDVFALGSILCEILTGRPAFTGRTSGEIQRKAARGETAESLGRLDTRGADAELVALARDCLATEAADRPRDANVVADRMTGHLEGVQVRAREAERDRAVAVATAAEERKRRRLQVGLAASVLALATLGGLGAFTEQRRRSTRAAAVARVIGEASTLRDLARAHPDDLARWRTALAAVGQAEGVAGGDPEALRQLGALRAEVRLGAERADRDRVLLDRLVDIRSSRADDPSGDATDAAYASAFRDAELNLAALPPAEAGERIKARPAGVALALAAALDDWAGLRRGLLRDVPGAARLAEVARVGDPDPWRNQLRDAVATADKDSRRRALRGLVETARFEELGVTSLAQLGTALSRAGDPAKAEEVLRRAQLRFPGDAWVNYELARALQRLGRRDDAIRFDTAARAIRPELAHELAHLLAEKGEPGESIAIFRDLARLQPGGGRHLVCLGRELQGQGQAAEAARILDRAVVVGREATRLHPDDAWAHATLANGLKDQDRLDGAVAEYREAIRLQPDYAMAHTNLGSTLVKQGKLEEAIVAHREAIRHQPDDGQAHTNLGNALFKQGKLDEAIPEYREAILVQPDYALAHTNLGGALSGQGKLDEALVALREATRLRPDDAQAHAHIGNILWKQGHVEESIVLFRKAIRLRADNAWAHTNLGNALIGQGKLDEGIAEFRESLRLDPDNAWVRNHLGKALSQRGKLDEAIAEFREAIRRPAQDPEVRTNLGKALTRQGQVAEAVVVLREAARLRPEDSSTRDALAAAEREKVASGQLAEVRGGRYRPGNLADRVTVADLCYDRKLYVAATRYYAEALDSDPMPGDGRQHVYRYNAACSALLAAAGRGIDELPPEAATRAGLRARALAWLVADREGWAKFLDVDPPRGPAELVRRMKLWKDDPDLAGVRDGDALARLPEAEAEGWRTFWADVDDLLERAEAKPR